MSLTVQEAALAWAQGKKVEVCMEMEWRPILPVGKWDARVLDGSVFNVESCAFRLALEPKLRPLTIEEWNKRVGQAVCFRGSEQVRLICGVSGPDSVHVYLEGGYTPDAMMRQFTFLDGSPCGVMEGGAQ